jgi:hypothetical protein
MTSQYSATVAEWDWDAPGWGWTAADSAAGGRTRTIKEAEGGASGAGQAGL